jgi:hypothetical protein
MSEVSRESPLLGPLLSPSWIISSKNAETESGPEMPAWRPSGPSSVWLRYENLAVFRWRPVFWRFPSNGPTSG